jgi:hypothetical protein
MAALYAIRSICILYDQDHHCKHLFHESIHTHRDQNVALLLFCLDQASRCIHPKQIYGTASQSAAAVQHQTKNLACGAGSEDASTRP